MSVFQKRVIACVATAVAYGAMVLVANLPGAVVLVVVWSRRRRERRPA